ncbi:MAG TPA: hypothetical protein VI981_02755 [Candidatus Paceibacterota bacterium]
MKYISIKLTTLIKKELIAMLIAAGVITLSLIYVKNSKFSVLHAQAQDQTSGASSNTSGSLPFGGQVSVAFYCCEGISYGVVEPVGGEFLWDYSATLYREFMAFEAHDQWMIGNYRPGGVCSDIESECEDSRPMTGTIDMIFGTSL